jgi:photosystem II stability/assembly factor-like uncharacterized protein
MAAGTVDMMPFIPPDAGPPADAPGVGKWSLEASGTTEPLLAVWGTADGSDVWVVGYGLILHSTDHGAHWSPTTVSGVGFLTVWGTSATDVYAAGGANLYHFDGSKWMAQTTQEQFGNLSSIWGRNATDVFAFDGDFSMDVEHNNGSGSGWTQLAHPSTCTGALGPVAGGWGGGTSDVFFLYEGIVGHSLDDGMTWTTTTLAGSYQSAYYSGIWGSSVDDLYVAGAGGTMAYTNDDGVSWNDVTTPTKNDLYSLWGSAPGDLYAVGPGVTIIHTTNYGASWAADKNGTATQALHGVWGTGPNDVYAVGDNGLILHH